MESHDDPMWASRRRRRLAAGVSLLIAGGVVAACIKKIVDPCTVASPLGVHGLVSLVQVQHEDLANLVEENDDRDALRKWLVATTEVGEATSAAQAASDMPDGPVGVPNEVVRQAMSADSPEEAQKVVKRVMGKTMSRWQEKRRGLKKYLNAHKRSLRKKNPKEKATIAECVFNVLQASDQVAALAANIKDATRTCTATTKPKGTSGKVCAVNIGAIFFSISTIAGALSLAAQNCADTFSTNVGALCAGAVSGIVANVAQLASMSALVSATCDPNNIDKITPGAVPHNFGQPASDRRLGQVNSTAAEGRRLLFGGGIAADATQCVIDATSIAWWLAQAGLAINSAANPDAAASCHLYGNKHVKGNAYRYSQSLCTVDVAGAIFAFGQAIEYLQLAASHCTDQLNLRAMCGAGIDGIFSSFAGFATSGSAVYTACHVYQDPKAKAALTAAGLSDKLSGGNFPVDALGDAGNFGRRLSSFEDHVAALQERFSSPEDAWKSIGYDLNDEDADFRKGLPPQPSLEELASLVEEPVTAQDSAATVGLFGSSQTCS